MKGKGLQVWGVTNRHKLANGDFRYSFFADFDDEPFKTVVKKANRVVAQTWRYAMLIRTKPAHYHLIIPGLFTAREVAGLLWESECDPYFCAFFFKHRRNTLRLTPKDEDEPAYKIVKEWRHKCMFKFNPCGALMPSQFSRFLKAYYPHSKIPLKPLEPAKTEFSEYRIRNGRKVYNAFLSPGGLNASIKASLGLKN